MKRIAIDEATSKLLDELTEASSRRRSRARWFGRRCASMQKPNDGVRLRPKMAKYSANTANVSPAKPARLSQAKRAREARRKLSHRERVAERGAKPGFYVVVSRTLVAEHEDVSTVICAPVYGEVLGLTTEVVLGPEDGLPRTSGIRCDFLTLMFKHKLTHFVSTLSAFKLAQLNRALVHALELPSR